MQTLASECFMPISYGGGITSVEHIRSLHRLGIEKTIINTAALAEGDLVDRAARAFGSQAIIGGIDVKKNWLGRYAVVGEGGTRPTKLDPVSWARELEQRGAGEILLYSIDRDGTWDGYDLDLIGSVTAAVSIPVIACGGAASVADFAAAAKQANASAVAAGSMAVYQKKGFGVLINFPHRKDLRKALG
jgi:cyclase